MIILKSVDKLQTESNIIAHAILTHVKLTERVLRKDWTQYDCYSKDLRALINLLWDRYFDLITACINESPDDTSEVNVEEWRYKT